MKRTGFKSRAPARPVETEEERAERLEQQALAAMKSVVPRAATMGGATGAPVPKEPEPTRDENYRQLVATLPCFNCRIEGASQAAHPNTGKAKGRKADDLLCFPMCHVGAKDCHSRFDQYKLVPRAEMAAFEARARAWTVRELLARGDWPKALPIPDIRNFQ